MPPPIRVLVVDDSAFVRKVVTQILSRSPSVEVVGAARDGAEALELAARFQPDVITLDLMMPRMNGVEFLRRQMAVRPVAVVACSIANESGEMAIDAFDAGAVEFVQKPTALATDRLYDIGEELVTKVKAASMVRMASVTSTLGTAAPAPTFTLRPRAERRLSSAQADVVVLGVSTGGPQALRQLVPQLPADFPVPIVMVLHMPVGYTAMYAERLNAISPLEVAEAREGDLLRPGAAFLAPAGRHLTLERQPDASVRAHLDLRPFDSPHRPSVDVLFRSAAEVYGPRVLGIVMTGMGSDGLLGAGYIKARGGRVVTEAESSCVVYGMPRSVDEAALSDRSVPLAQMAACIAEMV
jgi:two-component system chemotaxis response regulator CheB